MKNTRQQLARTTALALIAVLLLAGPVLAYATANHDLSWHVIAGGGERMESAGHTMWGTLGQPVVGAASRDHALCSGVWCGVPIAYQIYLPLVMRS